MMANIPHCSKRQDYENQLNLVQLRDALPSILSHLNIKDLYTSATVCKFFRDEVRSELKRRGIQVAVISIRKDQEYKPAGTAFDNFISKLKIKPKLALFFANHMITDDEMRIIMGENKLPSDCPIFFILGEAVIFDGKDICKSENKLFSAGVFFPEKENVAMKWWTVRKAIAAAGNNDDSSICAGVSAEILPSGAGLDIGSILGSSHSSAYFMFNYFTKFTSYKGLFKDDDQACGKSNLFMRQFAENFFELLKSINEKTRGKFNFAFLGCEGAHVFFHKYGDDGKYVDDFSVINLCSILGTGMKAWSIPVNMTEAPSVIEQKLTDFKNKICLKGNNNKAFAIISTSEIESTKDRLGKTEIFSRLFPNVQLLIYGLPKTAPKYCSDSTSAEFNPTFIYDKKYVCYLVISYA